MFPLVLVLAKNHISLSSSDESSASSSRILFSLVILPWVFSISYFSSSVEECPPLSVISKFWAHFLFSTDPFLSFVDSTSCVPDFCGSRVVAPFSVQS